MTSDWKYSKTATCRRMKKNIGDLVEGLRKKSGTTTKIICLIKKKYLTTNQALPRRDNGNGNVKE